MTPIQVGHVQTSFAKVAPIAEEAAALFYGRLFTIAPDVRPMFRSPAPEQGRKLMAALALVVAGLGDPEKILPAVRALAAKHVAYGVEPRHYAVVGAALVWTLEQGLGEAFTAEVEAAWTAAYALLSSAMIAAAYPQPQAA